MSTPKKVGGTKHMASPPLQKVGGHVPLSTDGSTPMLRTSSFRTQWYHLMPSNIRRHHWSSASILNTSVLETAQHSDPYRKIGRMRVLYMPQAPFTPSASARVDGKRYTCREFIVVTVKEML